ncbi:DNA-binding response regulator [Streptococcus sp. 121]|uniref:LytTR family transcriptional regulator DNA-binding domain-containing protein n=1 Tax=Streptococcus sp. 121 TaxID=2797637 RepID=UPI0018F06667|nr:LytTR family transcriptional regulator DNA-binding domain-containing protein [Streptococcus sp. 121]MBJ6745245.1 DNA-binding response regulator [Streptococcus sp. 121]
MNIYVYEERLLSHFWWEDTLMQILFSCGIEVKEIDIRSSFTQMLEKWEIRGTHQVFILVLYGDVNRQRFFELACQIRKKDPLASLIIVSDTLAFMEEVYRTQIGVLDYILKDTHPVLFHQRLASLFLQIHNTFIMDGPREMILLQTAQVQIQMPIKRVFFIERSEKAHYISIICAEEELSVIGSLQDIREATPYLFSCHRSILVNPKNILRVDRMLRIAYFPKGYSCPISRKKMKPLLDRIHLHKSDKLRNRKL